MRRWQLQKVPLWIVIYCILVDVVSFRCLLFCCCRILIIIFRFFSLVPFPWLFASNIFYKTPCDPFCTYTKTYALTIYAYSLYVYAYTAKNNNNSCFCCLFCSTGSFFPLFLFASLHTFDIVVHREMLVISSFDFGTATVVAHTLNINSFWLYHFYFTICPCF